MAVQSSKNAAVAADQEYSAELPPLRRDAKLMRALATVMDPELDLPITAMGLVYGAQLQDDGTAAITLTLTTVGCPLYETIRDDITRALLRVDGVRDVVIDLVFDPPWSPAMMSDAAKAEVGLL